MLAFSAGKSEFPVRMYHPIPGKRSGGAQRPKRSTVKERRGLQFGPPRMLLMNYRMASMHSAPASFRPNEPLAPCFCAAVQVFVALWLSLT